MLYADEGIVYRQSLDCRYGESGRKGGFSKRVILEEVILKEVILMERDYDNGV